MGYEYDHNPKIQDHQFPQKNNIFLPMFCRLSIKDVKLNHHCTNPTSTAAAAEPSSPKVTCIGQVKRTNRVSGFPAAVSGAGAHHHKHTNPKNLFPNKTLLPVTAITNHQKHINRKKLFSGETQLQNSTCSIAGTAVHGGGGRSGINRRCRTNKQIFLNNSRRLRILKSDQDCGMPTTVVDIGEMDPPLPVVKRVAPLPTEVNIWKRRFNGMGLENLQIARINLPNRKFEMCTDKNTVYDK